MLQRPLVGGVQRAVGAVVVAAITTRTSTTTTVHGVKLLVVGRGAALRTLRGCRANHSSTNATHSTPGTPATPNNVPLEGHLQLQLQLKLLQQQQHQQQQQVQQNAQYYIFKKNRHRPVAAGGRKVEDGPAAAAYPTAQEMADRLDDWKQTVLPLLLQLQLQPQTPPQRPDDDGKNDSNRQLVAWQNKKLQRSIRNRVAGLASEGRWDEGLHLLDHVHAEVHATLLESKMYHPLLLHSAHTACTSDLNVSNNSNNYSTAHDPNRISLVCNRLRRHGIPMDLPTLKLICRAFQQSRRARRILPLVEPPTSFTYAMYMEVIRNVWPAQGKRYLLQYIVPTNNQGLIRHGVEIILWKYRAIVSNSLAGNWNELKRTVRIAHNFYDRMADRWKGKATFLMMDMFCMVELPDSVVQLANTQPHPWCAAMYGLLIQAHRGDQANAFYWFKEMVKVCPNSGGFTVMLNILAKSPNATLVRQVHDTLLDLKDTVTPNAITIQALITCYGALRQHDQMLQVVRTYHHQQQQQTATAIAATTTAASTIAASTVASTSASTSATTGAPNSATNSATSKDMDVDQCNELTPIMDAANYQRALRFCGDDADAMNEIIDLMLTPSILQSMDDRRWSSVLDTIARLASEAAAMRVQELVDQRFPTNLICCTTAVKAWGEADVAGVSGERIWAIYKRLVDTTVGLDRPFCTAVLFYLSRSLHNDLDLGRARSLLERMEQQKDVRRIPVPDCDHYEPILHAFLARSQLDMAKKQIDRRIELALTGNNPAAEPVPGTYHQFIGAWVRKGKDLRLLTKILVDWNKIYQKHKQCNGPDLTAYEMLYVGWDRALNKPGRILYKRRLEEIIRSIVRLGDRTRVASRHVKPPPVNLRR